MKGPPFEKQTQGPLVPLQYSTPQCCTHSANYVSGMFQCASALLSFPVIIHSTICLCQIQLSGLFFHSQKCCLGYLLITDKKHINNDVNAQI